MFSKQLYRFSVFTATYNRSSCLRNLYNDLLNQSFNDFEWVVVNDGSTDDTDQIMKGIIEEGKLNIQYFKLPINGGKHKAWREGLLHFNGRYVISADDDDPFLRETLMIHHRHWLILEQQDDYNGFWEIRSRCMDSSGNLVGTELPGPWFDSNYIDVNIKMKNKAEMHGSRKVEILRKEGSIPGFLFEDKCSNYPEMLRWIQSARKYSTRFIPEITRIFEPNPSGLTKHGHSVRSLYNGFIGGVYMLLNNRDLLLKYDFKGYLMNIALVGYRSAQLDERVSKLNLKFPEYILSSCASYMFRIYLKIKKSIK